MGELVNLRQFRKRKARDEREKAAAENRSRHGRTGAKKDFDRRNAKKTDAFLEDNRLSDTPDGKN